MDAAAKAAAVASHGGVVLPLFTIKQKSKMMGEKDERLEQFHA
jgi:hypothetical protein